MSIQLINPAYSFVTFKKAGTQNKILEGVIPVAADNDLKFQFVVRGTKVEMDDLFDDDVTISAVAPWKRFIKWYNLLDGDGVPVIDYDGEIIIADQLSQPLSVLDYSSNNLILQKYRLNNTSILFYWPHALPGIMALNSCFRLVVKVKSNYYVSNVFKTTDDKRYTSTIEYYGFENSYGFQYCVEDGSNCIGNLLPNKIRLPFYISKPQLSDDEEIYVKSDGAFKILSSVTRKEYEGKTDYMNEEFHERVKVALSHDSTFMASHFYTGGIRKNGNYEIQWPEGLEDEVGYAEFKVFATPYNVRNSNCNDLITYG